MTDEEKTALKAEIVAELGRHLDEHYIKRSEVQTSLKEITDFIEDLDSRLSDLEWAYTLTERLQTMRMRPDSGRQWIALTLLADHFKQSVRKNVRTMLESIKDEPKDEKLSQAFDFASQILKD